MLQWRETYDLSNVSTTHDYNTEGSSAETEIAFNESFLQGEFLTLSNFSLSPGYRYDKLMFFAIILNTRNELQV